MRDTEEIILNVFKNNSSKELSTEFLAKEIYPHEFAHIESQLNSSENANIHDAKRKKFRLHRKLLYYINKLIASNIIKVSKIAEKGEKYFTLHMIDEDMIIEKGYKKIIINKPTLTAKYIDQYESKNVMKIYAEDSWINRFNSILLECPKNLDINILYGNIRECFSNVNDAIALNEFENILNTTSEKTLIEFVDKIIKDSENFDKIISIIINIAQVNNNIRQFIEYYAKINPKKINIVFNLNNKDIQKYAPIIEHIIEKFSDSKIKINFKNNDLSDAPYFKGRSGIYTFDEREWDVYIEKYRGKTIGINCSQTQIAVNINKFFETYKTDVEFRQAILDAAKTLLQANNIQRRKSNEYFKNLNTINQPNSAEFYKFSRNYIRFWNYDWHKDIAENQNIVKLIKSAKELVDSFCYSEETIFKSCGIPIRFKIAFSSAFRNFDQKVMGERDYKKVTVNQAEDYYTGEIKDFLHLREKMFEVFDGGDRLRIFRKSNFALIDIIHELEILLKTYKLPFFTYDFSGLKGTIRLTNFM
jgi:hypothetical protein